MSSPQPVLIGGQWRAARGSETFRASNPATREPLADLYPVSSWEDCDAALDAAQSAFEQLRELPGERLAEFLDSYAAGIEQRKAELVEVAHQETALPRAPRLADVELPRTTGQLRQAATAARDGSWRLAVVDAAAGLRTWFAPLGPVCVFGPNNFPFAFGSASGGDFAAAIAGGNPVIAKANSSHPGTTRLLAEIAAEAVAARGLPAATVQLLYRTGHADGERLVSDPRVGATGYTGSRSAGLKLKAAADAAGKPIYLELSSVNPVVILPGAIEERLDQLANEFTVSCLMGTGQFCTNPGLVVLLKGTASDRLVESVVERFRETPAGTLLSEGVERSLTAAVETLVRHGAELRTGDARRGAGFSHPNALLTVSGQRFLEQPEVMQTEAFGNASLWVIADNLDQARQILRHLEGNLTGCIYSHSAGDDDLAYDRLEPILRQRVGRLLNDKMPTGVAVSPAMNHGGPFPATGHPGFTAVGLPAAIRRFAMLHCYDNVRPHRLPPGLRDH
ncbi:MAG: aldehyde dehydrogenase (NADP(+)) [Pirellulaceae bacterium]|nr:aldehyde dehydrogenase (NADP(+)) [Pirellulaceae bacterium]